MFRLQERSLNVFLSSWEYWFSLRMCRSGEQQGYGLKCSGTFLEKVGRRAMVEWPPLPSTHNTTHRGSFNQHGALTSTVTQLYLVSAFFGEQTTFIISTKRPSLKFNHMFGWKNWKEKENCRLIIDSASVFTQQSDLTGLGEMWCKDIYTHAQYTCRAETSI